MKTKTVIASLLLFAGFTLSACYQKIDLSEHRTTPKIVINCSAGTDTVIMASITRTWFYPENTPDVCLPHADVKLYINGGFVEQMKWKEVFKDSYGEKKDSAFVSEMIPKEGDRIKIVASTPEYGIATAEDEIPVKVPIGNVSYTVKKEEGIYNYQYTDYYNIFYEITFNELPDERNYYLIQLNEPNYSGKWTMCDLTPTDPILNENESILDGALGFNGLENRNGFLFTDESINGQQYTLRLQESTERLDEGAKRKISIYSLSEAYYNYLLSLQKVAGSTLEGGLGNIGFAEPLRVYSNVEGGTGILATFQQANTEIAIKNIPKN